MNYTSKNPSLRYLEHIEYYKQMHNEGAKLVDGKIKEKDDVYNGKTTSSYADVIKKIIEKNNITSLLEYGCGKAYYYNNEFTHNEKLIKSLKDYWGTEIYLFDPCVIKYNKFPNNSVDLTLCIDVLEHIPEEDIDWVLEKFLSITKKFSFISVACYPAIATLPNGENAHITIHTPEWWLNKLSKFYKINPLLKIICLCTLGSNEDKKPYHELAINDNLQNYS